MVEISGCTNMIGFADSGRKPEEDKAWTVDYNDSYVRGVSCNKPKLKFSILLVYLEAMRHVTTQGYRRF